jgi:hypothetical protein
MNIQPSVKSTQVAAGGGDWLPASFADFLAELAHVQAHCASLNHYAIYRGHPRLNWRLDSTFARYVKRDILGIDPTELIRDDYRHSLEYHRLLSSLFLCKFGTLTVPSSELTRVSEENGLDPWFEWMKRIQQYPKADMTNLRGTFLLDWTQTWKIALFFANYQRPPEERGAVYVADMTQSGSVLHQDLSVGEILDKLHEASLNDKPVGCPLIFCPRKQIACQRARNQDAIYVAQMDLRVDLAEHWEVLDQGRGDTHRILLRIVLPADTTGEVGAWLEDKGITESYVYPDAEGTPTTESNATSG